MQSDTISEHTPFDSPLLNTNDSPTDARRCKFSEVNQDLGASDADRKSTDDTANNKMRNILRGALQDGTNHPDDGCYFQSAPTTKLISQVSSNQRTNKGASRHGSSNTTLLSRPRVAKVFEVLVRSDPCAHGTNLEPKEHATNSAKGGKHLIESISDFV